MEFPILSRSGKLVACTLAVAFALSACTDEESSSPSQRRAATAEASAGSGQVAAVGSAVLVAPEVTVRDNEGRPVAGVEVEFRVARGGGTATGTSAVTNASGAATVGSWTMGPVAGGNELIAVVAGAGPMIRRALVLIAPLRLARMNRLPSVPIRPSA
jgi:hypothetical protein